MNTFQRSAFTFLFVTKFALFSAFSYAGTRAHGGDIVICTDRPVTKDGKAKQGSTPPAVLSVELLDFFEGRIKYPKWKIRPIRPVAAGLASALSDVDEYLLVDPELSDRIFRSITGMSIRYGNDREVPEINDEGQTIAIPDHCYLKQVAIQEEAPLPGTSQIIVHEDWYDRLPIEQQVALIRHEALMDLFIQDFSIRETEGLRELNYLLSTTKIQQLTSNDWIDALARAGYSSEDLYCSILTESLVLDQELKGSSSQFFLLSPVSSRFVRNESCIKNKILLNQQTFSETLIRLHSNQIVQVDERASNWGGFIAPNTEVLYRYPDGGLPPLLKQYRIRGYRGLIEGSVLRSPMGEIRSIEGGIQFVHLSPMELPILGSSYQLPREIIGCSPAAHCQFGIRIQNSIDFPAIKRLFVDFRNELTKDANKNGRRSIFVLEADIVSDSALHTLSLDLSPTLPRMVNIQVTGQGKLRIVETQAGSSTYRFSCESGTCEIRHQGSIHRITAGNIWRNY